MVIGVGSLDQNISRKASRSHSFCSLLGFRMRLGSVPELLTDWPRVPFRSDLEGLILDQPRFIYSTQTERTSLDGFQQPLFLLFLSLFLSLFLTISISFTLWRLPVFCVGILMVILGKCGRCIGFFCRRRGSSQRSRPLSQLFNLSLFPKPLGPQSSTTPHDLTFTHQPMQAIPCCFEAAEGAMGSSIKCFLNGA